MVIQTATGPLPVRDLGPTLSHEHLFINLMRERRGDGLLHDERLAADELSVFSAQGGRTILDLTTAELTPGSVSGADVMFSATEAGQTREPRSIHAIQRVSRATGVRVVLGTGRYRDPYLDRALVDRLGVEGLADEMIRDLTEGFPGTDARAGVIGEIGANAWFISATEERVFRAAARAHLATGAPIYTHAARWQVGLAQLDLLTACGVASNRIAIGHLDTVPPADYVLAIARRGAFVGLDTMYSSRLIDGVLARLGLLVRHNYAEQVLLSHDVCVTSQLRANGGPGYGLVLGELQQRATTTILSEAEYARIVADNPRRLLVGR